MSDLGYNIDELERILIEAIKAQNIKTLSEVLDSNYRCINFTISPKRHTAALTPLHLAAKTGNSDIIKLLLKAGLPANVDNGMGVNALMTSARYGKIGAMRTLIDAGINVNAFDNYDLSAAEYAALGGKMKVFDFLLENGISVSPESNPLLVSSAVKGKKTKLVEKILGMGFSPNAAKSKNDYWGYPLTEAIRSHSTPMIQLLLSRGANPNEIDRWGEFPLFYAVREGMPEAVEALLSAGANPNATTDTRLETAFILAASSLYYSSPVNGRRILELLFDAGVDVNARDSKGKDALSAACSSNSDFCFTAVEFLLSKGVSTENVDNTGKTPLMHAAEANQWEAIELLLQNGANIEHRDSEGKTAVVGAWLKGNEKSFHVLVSNGALKNFAADDFVQHINKETLGKIGIMSALLSRALLPEVSDEIENIADKFRTSAMAHFLSSSYSGDIEYPEMFSLLTDGKPGGIVFSQDNKVKVAGLLLELMESEPATAIAFLKKRIGKNLGKWAEKGIDGAEVLLQKTVRHIGREGNGGSALPENVSNGMYGEYMEF